MANFFCQRIGSAWLVTIGLFAHFLVQLWPVMGKLKVLTCSTLFRFAAFNDQQMAFEFYGAAERIC